MLAKALVAAALEGPAATGSGPLPSEALALPAEGLLMGFDVKGFFTSSTYAQLQRGEMPAAFASSATPEQLASMRKDAQEGMAKAIKEAEEKTGLRLDKDIDRLVAAVSNLDGKEPEVAVVVLGRFDAPRITTAWKASQATAGTTSRTQTMGAVSALVFDKAGKPDLAIAFPDQRTLIFGSPGPVERTLANRLKGTRAVEANLALMASLRGLRPDAGLWFVAGDAPISKMKGTGPSAAPPPFPLPTSLSFVATFDGGMELAGEMPDDMAAKNVMEMIQGGLAMGRMQATKPGAPPEAAAMAGLLSTLAVKQEGRSVRVTAAPAAGGAGSAGLFAAIAIPSLLRARVSANEAAAIGDIRSVISAEAAYSSMNDGGYAELRCLAEPKTCKPSYTGPSFVDATLATLADKSGYKRAFFPGRPMKTGSKALSGFAYTAAPVEPGKTGTRSFCGDSSGVICFDAQGAAIQPVDGSCPKTCSALP